MTTDQTTTPGALRSIGFFKLGGSESIQYFECVTCRTQFPMMPGGISCNGQRITTCPWHGPDSQANAIARGDHLQSAAPVSSEKCECGGELKAYDGALGYDAMVCQSCGEHWNDLTPEESAAHAARYRAGKRNQ